MFRKILKKLLAPIVREVVKEQLNENAKVSQYQNDKVQDVLLKAVNSVNQQRVEYSVAIKHDDTISFNANEASEILDKIKLKSEDLSKNEHYYCVIVMYKITS